MSLSLTDLIASDGPVEREITFNGKAAKAHFKRITAGEREQILRGMKAVHQIGGKATVELDLCENEKQRHLLVFFSVCNPDGSRYFKKLDDVKAWPSRFIAMLAEHASAVNDEDGETGKS